jgi:hypothetical protein
MAALDSTALNPSHAPLASRDDWRLISVDDLSAHVEPSRTPPENLLPALERAWTRALADAPEQWIDRADRAGRGRTACTAGTLPTAAQSRCVALGWLTATPARG